MTARTITLTPHSQTECDFNITCYVGDTLTIDYGTAYISHSLACGLDIARISSLFVDGQACDSNGQINIYYSSSSYYSGLSAKPSSGATITTAGTYTLPTIQGMYSRGSTVAGTYFKRGTLTVTVLNNKYYSTVYYYDNDTIFTTDSDVKTTTTKPADRAVTVTSLQPTRSGWEFWGWSRSKNKEGYMDPDLVAGDYMWVDYMDSNDPVYQRKLYAAFKQVFTVTYKTDTTEMADFEEKIYYRYTDNKITTVKPTKAGRKFLGWMDNYGNMYYAGDSLTATPQANMTFTAVWGEAVIFGKVNGVWEPGDLYFWDGVE